MTLADSDSQNLSEAAFQLNFAANSTHDSVKTFFENFLSQGQNYYHLKSRVKTPRSIIKKVQEKTTLDENYNVENVNDILGFRIITLYRFDIYEVLNSLLTSLESEYSLQNPRILRNSIEEFIIYTNHVNSDTQQLPNRLRRLVSAHKINRFQNLHDLIEIKENDDAYTSIHITMSVGFYSDDSVGNKRCNISKVPLELQIRTVFEDAWCEISHALSYKMYDENLTFSEERMINSSRKHIYIMKSMIDGVAQYSDLIRTQILEISRGPTAFGVHAIVENRVDYFNNFDEIPNSLKTKIVHGTNAQHEATLKIDEGVKSREKRIELLRESIKAFQKAQEQISRRDFGKFPGLDDLAEYYLPMELALSHFRLGTEMNDSVHLAKAIQFYEDIKEEFRSAVVYYRHGRALGALGDLEAAIDMMETAWSLISDDGARQSWLMVQVPLHLSLLYWQSAHGTRDLRKVDIEKFEESQRENVVDTIKGAIRYVETAIGNFVTPLRMHDDDTRLEQQMMILKSKRIFLASDLFMFLDKGEFEKFWSEKPDLDGQIQSIIEEVESETRFPVLDALLKLLEVSIYGDFWVVNSQVAQLVRRNGSAIAQRVIDHINSTYGAVSEAPHYEQTVLRVATALESELEVA